MKKLFLAIIIVIVGALVLNAIDRIPTDEPTANENEYSGELEREYISPVKILWTQHGELISNIDYLLREGNGQADPRKAMFIMLTSIQKEVTFTPSPFLRQHVVWQKRAL